MTRTANAARDGGAKPAPAHRVTLLPGDGIGPEVVDATMKVLDASGARVDWEIFQVGERAVREVGDPLPDAVLESVRSNGVALKGPVTTPRGAGYRSVNISLRRALGLYGQVRLCRSFPGVPSGHPGIDLAVVRETTEDLYAGVELHPGSTQAGELIDRLATDGTVVPSGAGISIKYTSEQAVRTVARFALEWARGNGRKRITVVHKATVMRATDGVFLAAVRDVAGDFPDVEIDDCLVDLAAAHLVRCPERFDVILTSNLYGDILSDLAGGLVGSVGLVPGANYGGGLALFEAAHGSAPRYEGRDRVNPVATILTGALMLRHLGEEEPARRIERAVARVIAEGRQVTYDIARSPDAAVGTRAAADAVAAAIV